MKAKFRIKRNGGSLSLSENEIDSDELEVPVPFNLSEKTRERLNSASRSNKAKEPLSTSGVTPNGSPEITPKESLAKCTEDYIEMVP